MGTSFRCRGCEGVLDCRHLTRQPVLFVPQQLQMSRQRRSLVHLAVQHLADLRQPEAELAQQQHPLEPHQGIGVVVAVAVRADPSRRHQTDVVVMPQGAARRARDPGNLLNRPLHADDGRG